MGWMNTLRENLRDSSGRAFLQQVPVTCRRVPESGFSGEAERATSA
jgi:hypothetical protein